MEEKEIKYNNEPKKIGKYDYVKKHSSLGFFEPELINKLSTYCTLVKTDRTQFITQLLERELKDLTLTNNFLTLDKTYYFNYKELYSESRTKAIVELPLANLEDYTELIVIPNNLDKFDDVFKTYCYDRKGTHLGLDILLTPKELIEDDDEEINFNNLKVMYIIFRYISNKIEIGLIDPLMIGKFIDTGEYPELFQEFRKTKEELEKSILNGDKTLLNHISKPYFGELYLKQEAYDTSNKIIDAIIEISKVGLDRIKLVESEDHKKLIKKYEDVKFKENNLDDSLKKFKDKYPDFKSKMSDDEFKKIESKLKSEEEELIKKSELLKIEKSELAHDEDAFTKKYNEIVEDYVNKGKIITKNLLYFIELDNKLGGEKVNKKDTINIIEEYMEPYNTDYPIETDSKLLFNPILLIEKKFKKYLNEADTEFFDKTMLFVKESNTMTKEEQINLLEYIIHYER